MGSPERAQCALGCGGSVGGVRGAGNLGPPPRASGSEPPRKRRPSVLPEAKPCRRRDSLPPRRIKCGAPGARAVRSGVRRRHWRRARCWGFRAAASRERERAAAEAASKRFAGGKTLPKAGFTPPRRIKCGAPERAQCALGCGGGIGGVRGAGDLGPPPRAGASRRGSGVRVAFCRRQNLAEGGIHSRRGG